MDAEDGHAMSMEFGIDNRIIRAQYVLMTTKKNYVFLNKQIFRTHADIHQLTELVSFELKLNTINTM